MQDFIRLFENEPQGSGTTVSEPFRCDQSKETDRSLRMVGTLDGGKLFLQTLDPTVSVKDAIDADWANTDDEIVLPSYELLPFQRVNLRLKAVDLGPDADFTIDLLLNLK